MAPTGNLQYKRPIPNHPWVIETTDNTVNGFLAGLSPVDFRVIADPKGVWAVNVADSGMGSASDAGSAWVVSDECYRRVKAHRYSQSGQ